MDTKELIRALLMQTDLFPEDMKTSLLDSLETMDEEMVGSLLKTLQQYASQKQEIEAEYAQTIKELSKKYMKKFQDFHHTTKNTLLRRAEALYNAANEEDKESLITQL